MSQEQPRSPESQKEPIKYGDEFPVSGEIAHKPITPAGAPIMQSAETESRVIGRTQRGAPAAVMQSAATVNERTGLVGHTDVTNVVGDEGATVAEISAPGGFVVAESVAGEVVGQYAQPVPNPTDSAAYGTPVTMGSITIGDALEATAMALADKAVSQTDAAAIQAAETRASGRNVTRPGVLASEAQTAATINDRIMQEEDRITLSDILTDASVKMRVDKVATGEDAVRVIRAELRDNPDMRTYPGGVAHSMAVAARINQRAPSTNLNN